MKRKVEKFPEVKYWVISNVCNVELWHMNKYLWGKLDGLYLEMIKEIKALFFF